MCDGTLKPIAEVVEGDWVLTRDELSGELGCEQVVDPYLNPDRAIIELEVATEDGGHEVLETTYNHPFWVADEGWTQVIDLEVGDRLESPDGELVVVGLAWTGDVETVYNFGVEQTRSYFVGEFGAWVHNCFENLAKYLEETPSGARQESEVAEILTANGWKEAGSPDGAFRHFKDADGLIRARIDPPDPKTKYRHLHIYDESGNSLSSTLKPVGDASPAAHIPLE